jgi:hypothetical protein
MTPGALTNPCAIVIVSWGKPISATTVSTVKLDATTAFTRVGGAIGTAGDENGIDIWRLVGASITNASHTFDVTFVAAPEIKFIHAITFSGVDQATPVGTISTDNADTTSPSAISPAGGSASDLIVGGFWISDGLGTGTYGVSNLTQRGTTQNDAAILGAASTAGTAVGTQASIGGTWTTAASGTLTAGVVIKAAAAAATVTYPQLERHHRGEFRGEHG